MPLYKILGSDKQLQPYQSIEFGKKYKEKDLEDWIEANPEVLAGDEPLFIIGRQVSTPVGTIDLLALDSTGAGIIIELKRAPSQRDAIAQSIEYASWLHALEIDELRKIAKDYLTKLGSAETLEEAWNNTFGVELKEKSLNQSQRLFIVIEGLNDRMASMALYLRSTGVDINLLNYNFFRTETDEEILHIEPQVGEPGTSTIDDAKPTESRLLDTWAENVVEAYEVFKNEVFSKDLYPRPMKTGISFRVQMREGSTFICFFHSSENDISVWLRNDTLQTLIDFDQASKSIKENAPRGSEFTHKKVWFIVKFLATPDNARKVARLVLEEVVDRLLSRP